MFDKSRTDCVAVAVYREANMVDGVYRPTGFSHTLQMCDGKRRISIRPEYEKVKEGDDSRFVMMMTVIVMMMMMMTMMKMMMMTTVVRVMQASRDDFNKIISIFRGFWCICGQNSEDGRESGLKRREGMAHVGPQVGIQLVWSLAC